MRNRSWLIVPADDERKLGKAVSTGADVIVVDLADTVEPAMKGAARRQAAEWLGIHRRQITESRRLGRWVRIGALDGRHWREDLLAVMPGAPDGIILPRASGPDAVRLLAAEIYELEQVNQVANGSTRIIPVLGETALFALTITTYLDASLPRLSGLTWNAASLARSIHASPGPDADGQWGEAFRLVRGQTLLAAHALGLEVLDAAPSDQASEAGVRGQAGRARADGFTGMLAGQCEQVPLINAVFSPREDEIAEARALLAAGEGRPGATVDRRSLDQGQLRAARRTLGLEGEEPQPLASRAAILRPA